MLKFKVLFISKQMRKRRRLVPSWWSVCPSPISWSPSMRLQTLQSTVLRCQLIILHTHIAKSQIKLNETQKKQVWKLDHHQCLCILQTSQSTVLRCQLINTITNKSETRSQKKQCNCKLDYHQAMPLQTSRSSVVSRFQGFNFIITILDKSEEKSQK